MKLPSRRKTSLAAGGNMNHQWHRALVAAVVGSAASVVLQLSIGSACAQAAAATPISLFQPIRMYPQPDGRTLLAGTLSRPPNYYTDMAVARVLADGSPDTSFGKGSVVRM